MESMENTDLSFNEKKSIQVIKSAIATSKRAMMNDGLLLLLWGIGLSISNFYNFYKSKYLLSYQLRNILDVFQILLGVTILVITTYLVFRKKKVVTFASLTTRYIWVGVIIAHNIIVIITKNILAEINFELIQPIQLVLIGFALFISGGVYRYYLLVISGVVMWITAAVVARFDLSTQFLIRSIAEILCFILPGILMYNERRKSIDNV